MTDLEPGEYIARCPECGARKIANDHDPEPPGHLHGIEDREDLLAVKEGEARFVTYVREETSA